MTQPASLAKRLATLSESATLALNARVKQMAAEGRTIYNLTAGELAGETPGYIQKAVAQKLNQNKYTPAAGLPELRSAIAESARKFYGLDWIQAENVVVTSSTKPALYACLLSLIDPGDEVILPTPVWTTYNQLIGLVGGKVVEVPMTEDFDLDVPAIMAKVSKRTKVIVLNSPNNPTGTVFTAAALHDLRDLLLVTNITKVTVIIDDIYSKLVYEDDFTLVPACGFENMIISNGFSKSQAITGWRIGYLIAPEPITKAVTGLLSHITGNASLPSQHAALAALARGDKPPAATMALLKKQRQLVCQALDAIPKIKYKKPSGAFYVFLDIRALTDNSLKWCEDLLNQTGVAVVPGEAFDAPGFARLTFVADEATLLKALVLIKKFVEKA